MPRDTARPRTPGTSTGNARNDKLLAAIAHWQATGEVPDGYDVSPNGETLTPHYGGYGGFVNRHGWEMMAATVGGGTLGGMAAGIPFGGGAAGGAGAAASGIPEIPTTTGMGGLSFGGGTGAAGASSGAAGAGKMGLSKIFGKGGIDPTMLAIGGLQAALGSGGQKNRQSFHKGVSPAAGQLVDPVQALYNALAGFDRLGVSLNNRLKNGYSTPSSYVQAGPAPVSIPGLDFQIGGGLGQDPALKDPSLLRSQGTGGDMFTSAIPKGPNMPPGTSPIPVRRRNP